MLTKNDHLAYFREMTKDEQRQHLLEMCERCIDAAPTTLARKIEIYFND